MTFFSASVSKVRKDNEKNECLFQWRSAFQLVIKAEKKKISNAETFAFKTKIFLKSKSIKKLLKFLSALHL